MTFNPGRSGNVNGRPPGVGDKRTELRKLLDPYAESLVKKMVEMALGGDPGAMRLCIERLIPRIKGEVVNIPMPVLDMTKPQSLLMVGALIVEAVFHGQISPEHASQLSSMLDTQRKSIEIYELDARVSEIEYVFNLKKQAEKKNA